MGTTSSIPSFRFLQGTGESYNNSTIMILLYPLLILPDVFRIAEGVVDDGKMPLTHTVFNAFVKKFINEFAIRNSKPIHCHFRSTCHYTKSIKGKSIVFQMMFPDKGRVPARRNALKQNKSPHYFFLPFFFVLVSTVLYCFENIYIFSNTTEFSPYTNFQTKKGETPRKVTNLSTGEVFYCICLRESVKHFNLKNKRSLKSKNFKIEKYWEIS